VTVPVVTAVRMSGTADRAQRPLLVLGPSLGTSAEALWRTCAADLAGACDVLAWDLPGHGHNTSVPEDGFTVGELAAGVLRVVDEVVAERGDGDRSFLYAGDSIGGAVGLQLLLDAPDRVAAAALLCTGARIGTAETWTDRVDQVRRQGTGGLVAGSVERWFGPGFTEREPDVAAALTGALEGASAEGYAQACTALSGFDVRDRLTEIVAPVLAVAGDADRVTPTAGLAEIADSVRDGRLVELPGVAHLAPAEAPAEVARLLREHLLGESPIPPAGAGPGAEPAGTDRYAAGLAVRREVLGAAHVDRSLAASTDLTRDFQTFITEGAWGSVWTRPGLDRRSRSLITLTALVAGGHHDELALHVRAARTNGLTVAEIGECLLQTAVYCGVPAANTAFKIAQGVLEDLEHLDDPAGRPSPEEET